MRNYKVNIPKSIVQRNKPQKTLVLSAGGSFCAYQAGVLTQLVKECQYTTICGVSGGALNAAFLSMFPLGNEEKAVDELKKVLFQIDQDDIYKDWGCFGMFAGLWKKSFKNSEPLQQLVNRVIDANAIKTSCIKLRVGAVNIETGEYQVFNENSKDIKKAVAASSAFPGFFEPVD